MRARKIQRGISLLGLLFWAVIIGGGSVIVLRVVPTVMEYYTIQRAIDKASGSARVPAVTSRKPRPVIERPRLGLHRLRAPLRQSIAEHLGRSFKRRRS